jgi:hypothetical protein
VVVYGYWYGDCDGGCAFVGERQSIWLSQAVAVEAVKITVQVVAVQEDT